MNIGKFNIFRTNYFSNKSKRLYFLLMVISRVYTTRFLGWFALLALGAIINEKGRFLIWNSVYEWQFVIYQLFLDLSIGYFFSFVFYFIVVHIPRENRRSAIYIIVRNKLFTMGNNIRLFTIRINNRTKAVKHKGPYSKEERSLIFKSGYDQFGEITFNIMVYQEVLKIDKIVDELLFFHSDLDHVMIRYFSQMRAGPIYFLKMMAEQNIRTIGSTDNIHVHLKELDFYTTSLTDHFHKSFALYQFESATEWSRVNEQMKADLQQAQE